MRVTKSEAFAIGAIAVVGAFAVAQAWGRALSPIIDVGRDFYVADHILHGQKLYRDLVYIFPPLTPYLLAALIAITGASLNAFAAIGLITGIATAALVYAITRVTAGWPAAAAATLLFTACNLTVTSPIFDTNYLAPYTYAAIFALLFFLGSVASLAVYLFVDRRGVWMALAIVCALVAAWTKIEYALFGAVMLIVMTIVHRIPWRWLALYAAGAAVSLLLALALFPEIGTSPLNAIPRPMMSGAIAKHFYSHVTGTYDWLPRIEASLLGVIAVGLFAVLVIVVDRLRNRHTAMIVAAVVTIAYGVFIVSAGSGFLRAWTIFQLALIPFAIIAPRQPLALLLLASICTTSRVPLNVSNEWYGFVYVVPLYALFAYIVFEWLPKRGAYSRAAAWLWLAPIVAFSMRSLIEERALYRERQFPVTTSRGTFYDDNRDRAEILSAFVREFRGPSMTVMPEGVSLNFLTGVPATLRYYSFVPLETAPPEVEGDIIANFIAAPPEAVVIVPRDMSVYGFRGLGIDYDRGLTAFITSHYRPEKRWRNAGWTLLILRRRT